MQAPKNGFFYVLDQQRLANSFLPRILSTSTGPVTWTLSQAGRSLIRKPNTGRLASRPSCHPRFSAHTTGTRCPTARQTGLVYLPAQQMAFPFLGDDDMSPKSLAVNIGLDTSVAAMPDDAAIIAKIKQGTSGRLLAWDPVSQKEVWRVEYPGPWNGGVLSTAGGLVFQGSATGYVNAYRADDGERLWQFPAQTGIVAPPISYAVGGEQYITVSAGWGGIFPLITGPLVADAAGGEPINRSRLLTFKLGGTEELPPAVEQLRDMPDLSDLQARQSAGRRRVPRL